MNRYPSYRGGGITGLPHYGKGGFFQGLKGGLWDLVKDVAPKALTYMNPWIGIPADILKNKVLEGKGWKDSLVGGAKNLVFDQALKAGMAKASGVPGLEGQEDLLNEARAKYGGDSVEVSELSKSFDENEFGLGSLFKDPKSLVDVLRGGVGYMADPENAALLSL